MPFAPRSLPARLAWLAWAALAWAPGAWPADAAAARAQIIEATERLLGALDEHRPRLEREPELAWRLAEELVTPHIDFAGVARQVLGRHWDAAGAGQRERFTAALRAVLVNTYVTAMAAYADRIVAHADRLRFPPARARDRDGEALVRMVVRLREGLDVDVDYRMRDVGGRWRVQDVRIEGISLVLVYRRSLGEAIARDGLDRVIAALEARAGERGR